MNEEFAALQVNIHFKQNLEDKMFFKTIQKKLNKEKTDINDYKDEMMEIEMNWNQTEIELKNQNLEYEKKVKALEYELNETMAVLNSNEIILKNSKVN